MPCYFLSVPDHMYIFILLKNKVCELCTRMGFFYFFVYEHAAESLWTDNTFYLSGSKHADTKKYLHLAKFKWCSYQKEKKNIKLHNDTDQQVEQEI